MPQRAGLASEPFSALCREPPVCTLIVVVRGSPSGSPRGAALESRPGSSRAALIVAANRDEFYDRAAEGPAIRNLNGRRILAPLDLRAGGTWLGLNEESVFAAVTNLRNDSPDPQRRSRGWIVMDALSEPTAALAADMLKALPEETYNPFQCLVADGERAFHLVYRRTPRLTELEPGVHVIGNVDPREEPAPKVERIRARVAGVEQMGTERAMQELARVCAEHGTGGGGVGDTCVHVAGSVSQEADAGYGTRSSILLALPGRQDGQNEDGRLLVANGAPCTTGYEDQTSLLVRMRSGV